MIEPDQIKALAELDGWRIEPTQAKGGWKLFYELVSVSFWWNESLTPSLLDVQHALPKYLTSYDAIIPLVEKCVVNGSIANPNRFILDLNVLMTPAKLCEALLHETGKWTWKE